MRPLDVNPLKGKWLIDKPYLNKIDKSYEELIIKEFKDNLSNKTEKVDCILDFNNVMTFQNSNTKIEDVLGLYKEQLDYDYLITIELSLIKNITPEISYAPEKGLYRELNSKIYVYDLNSKKLIFEKEYFTSEKILMQKDRINIIGTKLEKFIFWTVEKMTKDFQEPHNWSLVF
ncbi:hypothetical protein [uncultured Flavobacterium sp.]|uniref:hypothetical protein n=1 Tax=uncultured Flavobacterium sp. TaxID=165435 RepID=UPI0030EE9EC7|tara:strand:- start:124429 stop:124950 length:522 start_codon:yes stop_codon:yes gene_type:complete